MIIISKIIKIKKYGGSSLKDIKCIKNVAQSIKACKSKQIVVVSAREGFTSEILSLAKDISTNASKREIDQMIVTGEMINASLLAIALNDIGVNSISCNALSIGIKASKDYGDGMIISINKEELERLLEIYDVVVVTGFQGINDTDFVSLGRGGSDTTALAIASIFEKECYIYTDVNGVYTIDPKLKFDGRKIDTLSYQEMLELSLAGSKVLYSKASQIAYDKKIKTTILKSLESNGTVINEVESYGVKALQVIDNVDIKSDEFNSDKYIIVDNKHYFINKTEKGEFSNIILVGSFLKKENIDKSVVNILEDNNIKYNLFYVQENNINFIISKEDKEKTINLLMKKFNL